MSSSIAKKNDKKTEFYVGITMVCKLHLTTRCGSTMAAGTMLSGHLHGRQHTPRPLTLPPHTPKDAACPWTALALPEPPRHKRFSRPARRNPSTIPSMLFSRKISYPRCLRRGSWQWQSLAHRLALLLPSPITSPTTTPITPHTFDPIAQWLPTLYSTAPSSSTNDNPTHAADDPSSDDIFPSTNYDNDVNDAPPLPSIPTTPPQHTLSITRHNIPSQTPPTVMDISQIYTQNAHDLWCRARDQDGNIIPNCKRDTTKFEHLIHRMCVDDIDAWLIQETWLEDDGYDTVIGGYHIFRHNSPIGSTGRDHLFRGVAIILSPRYYLAWKAAGSPSLITMASTSVFAGRFIGLNLKFDCFDSRGWRVKGKSLSLFLASIYHPCHDIPHEQFLETLGSLLHLVPKKSKLIIGADINAKVGRRDCEEFKVVLGPHGPTRRNTCGSNLLSLYLSHQLRIENTFIDAPKHTTFTNMKDSDQTMIDIFACAKTLHCRVRHCRVVAGGIESDHTAVQLNLVLTSLKRTDSTALHHGTTDWRRIATDHSTKQRYNDLLTEATTDSPGMSYEDFNEAIKKAGKETALLVGSRCDD